MTDYVIKQIIKIRNEKGLSQKALGDYLSFHQSGLSKIETGKAKLDVERLGEIAKVLEVDIMEFFPKPKAGTRFEDSQKSYGYANKADIDEITFLIKQLKQDITSLRKEVSGMKIHKIVKKK